MSFLRSHLKLVPRLQLFRKFSSEKPWQEVSIPVPWGQIRGKWWGPTDVRPILTLHGWQDNCGTWDRLIPLLNQNLGFLAIELPGHGLSSNLPAGIYYHYTTYLIVVKAIIKYFAWPKVSLMGHSMGGITCYMYTMLYPENVDFLACVDGAKPKIRKNQDNTGTWDRLIPLLNRNVGFLAIDLPGHGFSSNLPPGTFYHFTSYLLVIKYIIKYFDWPKIALMGHSLGGIFSYTYTMLYPASVEFVVSIDGLKPLIRKGNIKHISESMDNFLVNNKFAASTTEPPSYTLEEIKTKIHEPNNKSVHLECAHYLMERNIAPSKKHPGKYYFTRDPRLKSQNLIFFTQEDLVENARDVTCPIFVGKCKGASYFEKKENFFEVLDVLKQSSSDCEFHFVEGTHHTHLNNPGHELAGLIKNFIQKYYDGSMCNINRKCFVTEDDVLGTKAYL